MFETPVHTTRKQQADAMQLLTGGRRWVGGAQVHLLTTSADTSKHVVYSVSIMPSCIAHCFHIYAVSIQCFCLG